LPAPARPIRAFGFRIGCGSGHLGRLRKNSARTRQKSCFRRFVQRSGWRNSPSGPSLRERASPSARASAHPCIQTRALIEDWNVTSARLGQFTVPSHVVRAMNDCARCESVLQERLASLTHFRELHSYPLPDKLHTYPVSPLFVKEGKRMLLNWSAALGISRRSSRAFLRPHSSLGSSFPSPASKLFMNSGWNDA